MRLGKKTKQNRQTETEGKKKKFLLI